MKFVRFSDGGGVTHWGEHLGDGTIHKIEGDVFGDFRVTGEIPLEPKLLAPIQPSQIWCIGLNYRRHAEETKAAIPEFPVLFMKGINAVQHPGAPILIPRHLASERVDYECELAVVIGKAGKNISPEKADEHILGYTCANDVSARDWQIKWGGSQWCRGKTFDTFCPLGPCIVTPDEIGDPNNLGISTTVAGEKLQDWRTSDMIFDIPAIISFLSGSTTLLPGTVILTGTPHGVGMAREPKRWLQPGEEVIVEIDKIGALRNPVELEPI